MLINTLQTNLSNTITSEKQVLWLLIYTDFYIHECHSFS